jgi:hypothetical protein
LIPFRGSDSVLSKAWTGRFETRIWSISTLTPLLIGDQLAAPSPRVPGGHLGRQVPRPVAVARVRPANPLVPVGSLEAQAAVGWWRLGGVVEGAADQHVALLSVVLQLVGCPRPHRLCRGGNRQLNAAVHRIAITELRLAGSG